MTVIRVVLVEIPQLLGDILEEAISRHPDIELVGSVPMSRRLHWSIRRARPDVIVCHADAVTLPPVYAELFEGLPHLRVLAIDASDLSGSVYELQPVSSPLDVGPQGLVDSIRAAWTSGSPFTWAKPSPGA